jgi:hypothetical protein
MGEERKLCAVLVGKREGKRPVGRPRRMWEDGIRMDLGEIGLGVVDWIRLAQVRDQWWAVVSAVMNLWVLVPWSYVILSTKNLTVCFPRMHFNFLLSVAVLGFFSVRTSHTSNMGFLCVLS